MKSDQAEAQSAIELVARTLGKPLGPGELGALMARAGVGKTACLTHIALEHLFKNQPVLHVSVDGTAEKIKIWYQELIKDLFGTASREECTAQYHRIESLRFILAYLHQTFSVQKLEKSLQDLQEQTDFHPALIVLDGLDFDQGPRATATELKSFAQAHGLPLWMSIRTHRHIAVTNEHGIPYPCHETDELFDAILLLEPSPSALQVRILKHGGLYRPDHPDIFLNPQTCLMLKG
ncbi:MAG TPA: AAA family ATPase [Syntrophobacteraceae bacterium]|nr:AAA family ATPase [Syntrophobacteraceae bacterium]